MKFYVRRRRSPSIIIVSLIDILTILLIFFVVSTTFRLPQPQVTINLPESGRTGSAPVPERRVVVHVTADERIFLDARPVTAEELAVEVKAAQDAGRSVVLKADRQAPFGAIIRIIDALKAAGVRALPAFTQAAEPLTRP